jgi:hypothetical protein
LQLQGDSPVDEGTSREAGADEEAPAITPEPSKPPKRVLKENVCILFPVLDIEVIDNDAHRPNLSQIALIILDPHHQRLPGPGYNSLIKPPPGAFFNKICTKLTGLSEAELKHARPARIVLLEVIAYIDAAVAAYKVAHPDEVREVVVCLTGHNIAACDLNHIWHAMRRDNIPIPPLWHAYWCTLNAIKQGKAHALNDNKWLSAHPESPIEGHSVVALLAKMCVLQPSRQEEFDNLSARAHDALADVEMNIAFIAEEKFWALRSLKRAGMKPLADVWEKKQEAFDIRCVACYFFI